MTNPRTQRADSGTVSDVKAMYEAFPYPSPVAGKTPIEDVANSLYSIFGEDPLEGKRILDAGCGTGQRLLALARRYPRARLVGLDMTTASLDVARSLVAQHGLTNVELQAGDLVDFDPPQPFDIVASIGVVHHLEDPCRGLRALTSHLADDGILLVWLYHALGEHQRLLDREILLTLWDRASGFEQGLQTMRDLGLTLDVMQYGSSASQAESEVSQLSIDVDAFLHPIVNAYRFEQAIDLLRECAPLAWCAINNINLPSASSLIDLAEAETGELAPFCVTLEDLFDVPALRERYRKLDPVRRLRVLENRLEPTGFTLMGGRGAAAGMPSARVRGNAIALG